MEDYEGHLEDLDKIAEGLFSGIGKAIKGFGKGVSGEEYTDADKESGNAKKHTKGLRDYVKGGGAGEGVTGAVNKLNKQQAGIKSTFKIGNNVIENVSKELIPILFKLDENGEYQVSYDFEGDKYKLRWLLDGNYEAKSLGIKGKSITFQGVWKSGEFRGIMRPPSSILGGYINNGYYLSNPDGFKIPPYNFIKGGYSTTKEFIMGLRIVQDNKSYKSISLVQVPKGKQIKIIDNNDKEHLLRIDKGIDYTSLDFKINGIDVSWENYNRSQDKFLKSQIKVGENFSIPGVVDISKGIQSIEIKASAYESKEVEGSAESKEGNDIKFPNPVEGWMSVDGGYKLDINALEDKDVKAKVDRFSKDSSSGQFEKWLKFFKKLVDQGRIDGYGKYPALIYIWPEKGVKFKEEDKKRDSILKYFADFTENVIDNYKSDKVTKYYENKIKSYTRSIEPKKKAVKKPVAKAKPKGRTVQAKPINESKLSIKSLIEDFLKK